jgi:uncharacterized protein with HEPN domain
MNLETKKSLFDIIQSAKEIQKFTDGLDKDDFQKNSMIQSAVERKFEIIGEALNRIVKSEPVVLGRISDYPRIIGFRNIIAHGYDVVDVEIMWEALSEYLPRLVCEVEALLKL